MSIFPNFIRSLLLTVILSFVAPMVLVGGGLVMIGVIGYIPILETIAAAIADSVLQFLATFGSGSSFQGLVVIGLACSLVGGLFDSYAFYRYQSLRDR